MGYVYVDTIQDENKIQNTASLFLMKKDGGNEHLVISEIKGIYEGVTCQEIFLNKRVFVERYLPDIKPSLEILIFVGLNITPSVKYFGYFPHNLCKE